MNKKSLPILILILIVIICIAILVKSLAAPTKTPVQTSNLASFTPSTASNTANQPATTSTPAVSKADGVHVVAVHAPGGTINAEVASTSDEQALGLGNRQSLPANNGMLFPFAHPGDYGFWMKDMNFPLDMVWISSNKKVVSVTSDISPNTYPTVFYPPLAISYVLEINAGAAVRLGIATDTQLEF